jgi:RNA polymerase sigma-70 factor, ECF subfamily
MRSSTAARSLTADYSVVPDFGTPATNDLTNAHDTWQFVQDFRAELLTMIPQLRAFARMLCCDKNNADELSLKTLAKARYSRHAVGPETNLKAWLFTIARNEFYSNRHYELRKAPPKQGAAKGNPSYSAGKIRSADVPDTMGALRLLPDQFREALILVSASSCSYEEAAKICSCPIGTVKSRIFRARRALAANFDALSGVR